MEVAPVFTQTPIEQMRDLILSIDFEAMSDESEVGFTFEEWLT